MSSQASSAGAKALRQGAKRDPELYILGAIMAGALSFTGWYFGNKPTSSTSERHVRHPSSGGMPWHHDDEKSTFKYRYHPHGDERLDPKEAPSALHSVVVPNVNLPKSLHDKYNKYGKEEFE